MGEMERILLESRKQEHQDIATALHDFGRLGYTISGISHKNGALEVICHPPQKEEGGTK
jgi:hypothetical protein